MKKIGIILVILLLVLAGAYFIFKPFGYSKKELAERYINKSCNITKNDAANYTLEKLDEQFYNKPEVKELFTEKGLKKAKDKGLIVEAIGVAEMLSKDVKVTSIDTQENGDGTLHVKFNVEMGNKSVSDGFVLAFAKEGLKNKIDDIISK